MSAFLTVATSTEPARLTKLWHVLDGKPTKVHAGNMMAGQVNRLPVPTPAELVAVLEQLEANQALIFGLPAAAQSAVVSSAKLPSAEPGTIARTKEAFSWNAGPGWLLLDGDPAPGQEPLTREQWLALLFEVFPGMKGAPMVWGVSSSSCIHNAETGEQVTGIRGQRLYVLVADARDIPRAGQAMFERLWLAGHGYFLVSRSGSLLSRSVIDASVWQTNRLDFAAPPVCKAPLEARRPAPEALNDGAEPLDTAQAIPSLSKDEGATLAAIMAAERGCDDLLAEVNHAQEVWLSERVAALKELPEDKREAAEERLRDAVQKKRLFGDFELLHSSGKAVTVGQVLDDPDRWHGERFHDPLEPEYSNSDRRIAYANLKSGGPPFIYSHAHGGVRFRLMRPAEQLKVVQGQLPQLVAQIAERLRMDGEVFERAGMMVRLADGELRTVERPWLQTHLEGAFTFLLFDGRSGQWAIRDCPDKVAARVMAARGAWGLPKVGAVVTFPAMRPDGSIIEKPGFDEQTGLLYLNSVPDRPVPQPLDRLALVEALRRIWQPFELFPFDGAVSRGVFLSALLTTVCRPALPTAPAFLVRATAAGTGKTLLSECLMMLVGASLSAMPLPESNAEEIEKRLFAKLLTGCPGLILDNLVGVIDNAAMCAFLTSPEPEGRILGQSETRQILNRALWLLNGNNVTAGGDTFRRILPITLDANEESPETRRFTFNPRHVIGQRLEAYRADLLSVLLTYQWQGAPVVAAGAFGSFDEWEALVRQCVCWLIRERLAPADMTDPLEVMTLSKAEDPHHQQHVAVLEAWFQAFGSRIVQVREITNLMTARGFDHTPGGLTKAEREFVELVKEIKPLRGEFEGRYFSGWLRRHKGRVVGGLRLDPGPKEAKEPGWYVTALF